MSDESFGWSELYLYNVFTPHYYPTDYSTCLRETLYCEDDNYYYEYHGGTNCEENHNVKAYFENYDWHSEV